MREFYLLLCFCPGGKKLTQLIKITVKEVKNVSGEEEKEEKEEEEKEEEEKKEE